MYLLNEIIHKLFIQTHTCVKFDDFVRNTYYN